MAGTGCCDLLDPEEDHVERRLWVEIVRLVEERRYYNPREVSARLPVTKSPRSSLCPMKSTFLIALGHRLRSVHAPDC